MALQNLNRWENVFLTLLCFAILLPVGSQSTLTGFLLIWFISKKAWRALPLQDFANGIPWNDLWKKKPIAFILALSVAVSCLVHLLSFLLQGVVVGDEFYWSQYFRLMGKQGLYGLFVIAAFTSASRWGWRLEKHLNLLCCLVLILTVYVLVQRYTGIDWVKGFTARLPDNRYSHGVYRTAGFLSHPLLFGHNVMLFVLMTFGFALKSFENQNRSVFVKWLACSLLALVCLYCSGSRVPLLVTTFLMLIAGSSFLLRSRRFWLGLFIASIALSVFDQGTIKRYFEVFDQPEVSWEQRIPRIVFWKVHWSMFVDQPLLGVGYVHREEARIEHFDKLGYAHMEQKYSAHNIFLQTLADSGMLGFLSLLSLLLGMIVSGVLAWQMVHFKGLLLVGVATILTGLMQNNLRDSTYLFSLWMCFAWFIANQKDMIPLESK